MVAVFISGLTISTELKCLYIRIQRNHSMNGNFHNGRMIQRQERPS